MERVTVGGVDLAVSVAGADDAPPLLLLHGWPESHHCWDEIAPRLAGRFRLLMPDLRGFGASDAPSDITDYGMPVVTADAVAVLEHFGLSRAGVVGHDFGGAVAWALGAFLPSTVSAMVVLCSPHPLRLREAAVVDPDQWRRSFYVWLMHAGAEGEALLASDGFRTLAEWAFAGSRIPADTVARYREQWSEPGRFHAMGQWYRANFRPSLFDPGSPAPSLPPVQVPTRYLHGESDPAFVPGAGRGSGAYVSAPFEETVVAGAGHWLPHDEPGMVADAIGDWLSPGRW